MRRDAISQVEKPRKPLTFLLAERGDGHEIVGPTDHRTNGNHHNVHQWVYHFATTRVCKLGEVLLNPGRLRLGHDRLLGLGDSSPLLALNKRRKPQLPNHTRLPRRFGLPPETPVASCYEAGRDGFWLHRCLLSLGVANEVVDSSSIEVDRRQRRAKTDRWT